MSIGNNISWQEKFLSPVRFQYPFSDFCTADNFQRWMAPKSRGTKHISRLNV